MQTYDGIADFDGFGIMFGIGSQFIVYDQLGKEVKSGVITSEETEIDLSNLTEGVYLFKVGADMTESFKIIKQ